MRANPNARRSASMFVACWNDAMQAAYVFFTRTWMPAFLAIAALALLAGAQAHAKTLSLPVAAAGSWGANRHAVNPEFIADCWNKYPSGPPNWFTNAQNGRVYVGYDYYYDPGLSSTKHYDPIKPFAPCWSWSSTSFRGYVRFNLSQVKVLPVNTYIKSARLVWVENEPVISNGKVATNEGECVKASYVAETAWKHYTIPGIRLTTRPPDGVGYDVTKFVRQWASSKRPNHGFFFVGTDESLQGGTNKACYTFLYNIRLKVVTAKMAVPHFKDVGFAPKILAPAPNHLFINQDVNVQVKATLKHPNPSRWKYEFEFQRVVYHTKANNHYARPNPKPTDWPLVTGQFGGFDDWHPVGLLAENGSVSTLHLSFAALRSNHFDYSYEYRFRVRESLGFNRSHGDWSGWRSFIVSELVPAAGPLTRPLLHVPRSRRQLPSRNRAHRALLHVRRSKGQLQLRNRAHRRLRYVPRSIRQLQLRKRARRPSLHVLH